MALAGGPVPAGAAPTPAPAGTPAPPQLQQEVYVDGLEFPVDMVHVPGTKKIFFTEKYTGKIRVLRGQTLRETPCVDLKVNSNREQGAGGLVLDPDFSDNHYLYVYFQSRVYDDNRIVRFTVQRNRCIDPFVVFKGIRQAPIHNGGQLEFMGGDLYVSTGDAMDPSEAQDTNDLSGKILRINPDGTVPDGNPFSVPGFRPNPVWTIGHRNPFGLAVRPSDPPLLLESENGPTCSDEVNVIEAGKDYGWGDGEAGMDRMSYERAYCETPPPQPTPPLWEWGAGIASTIAPTDLAWYEGPIDQADGRFLMGDFKEGDLRAFEVGPTGDAVGDDQTILSTGGTPIIDVMRGPGGLIYLATPDAIVRVREPNA